MLRLANYTMINLQALDISSVSQVRLFFIHQIRLLSLTNSMACYFDKENYDENHIDLCYYSVECERRLQKYAYHHTVHLKRISHQFLFPALAANQSVMLLEQK